MKRLPDPEIPASHDAHSDSTVDSRCTHRRDRAYIVKAYMWLCIAILYSAIALTVSGCAVPMVGMSDDTCRGIPGCHPTMRVSAYVQDGVNYRLCGNPSWGVGGSRYKPWDPECRAPNEPQLQQSGPIWNPAVDPVQRNYVERESAILADEVVWCRTSEHVDAAAHDYRRTNWIGCNEKRQRILKGELSGYGQTRESAVDWGPKYR